MFRFEDTGALTKFFCRCRSFDGDHPSELPRLQGYDEVAIKEQMVVRESVHHGPLSGVRDARSTFVGRSNELEIFAQWHRGEGTLLTIVGPPGVGKTRLARYVLSTHTHISSCFVQLSECRTEKAFIQAVASGLGVTPLPGAELGALIVDELRSQDALLLLLDNFEQLIDVGCDVLCQWMESSSQVRFLITSQEVLRLEGEQAMDLRPLSVPPAGASTTEIEGSEAVALFIDRVCTRQSLPASFNNHEQDCMGRIVRRLDGLPLAIELAASRVPLLGIEGVLKRLGDLDMLAYGGRDKEARHQTLRRAIGWSWELLTPAEQEVLAQCSIFEGNFDVEAAEAVLMLSPAKEEEQQRPLMLDLLQRLRDRSLLSPAVQPTYLTMLQSIKAFAHERLSSMGLHEATTLRHARYYSRKSAHWVDMLDGDGVAHARHQILLDRQNLLAVIERENAPAKRLQAAIALCPVLSAPHPGPMPDLDLLETVLEETRSQVSGALRARALLVQGRLHQLKGRLSNALAMLTTAQQHAQDSGELRLDASCASWLGLNCWLSGEFVQAEAHCQKSASRHAALGDGAGESWALYQLALAQHDQGRHEEALDSYLKALDRSRSVGCLSSTATIEMNLARLRLETGLTAEAVERLQRAQELAARIGDIRTESSALTYMAHFMVQVGAHEEADIARLRHYANRALTMHRRLGYVRGEASLRSALGNWCIDRGSMEEAQSHFQRAYTIHRNSGDGRGQASERAGLGIAAWALGNLRAARTHFEEGAAFFSGANDKRLEAVLLGFAGAVTAQQGDLVAASETMELAEGLLDPHHDDCLSFLGLCRAHLELIRAAIPGEDTHLLTNNAARRLHDALPHVTTVLPRYMTWVVERRLPPRVRRDVRARALAHGGRALVIDETSHALLLPGGTWVELGTSLQLWRMIYILVERHRDAAPPIDRWAFIEAIWPEEYISPESAINRLNKSLSMLRRKGLRDLFRRVEDGYCLVDDSEVLFIPPLIGIGSGV